MKLINEARRMQQLAGLLRESETTPFQELKKAVKNLTSDYTGDDVSIAEDDAEQEIYIETFEKPVFTALLKKVRDELKGNPSYKIDVDNIDREGFTFEIIKK